MESHTNCADNGNCPYELASRLETLLGSLPETPSREIASLHACARIMHMAAFHIQSDEMRSMAGELIILAAQIEKGLAKRKVSVFDPYEKGAAV